ncbi:MAG TPA: biopolymer transporter ExbD [Elusimicrobiales bacterium]|nr:biopolymer transporter ExbD [Elusimicrobiales bacterium]
MSFKVENDDTIMAGINVAPLVDVCLVLVIIFMVTAPLLSDPALKVNLPQAKTQEGEEKDKVTVTISAEAKYAVNEKVFTSEPELLAGVGETLKNGASKMVVIKADAEAGYGILTDVMRCAKEAGATGITIATEQKGKKRP